MTERRIYIHEHSFRTLCHRAPDTARAIYHALLRVAAGKMLHRHVCEDGVLTKNIPADLVPNLEHAITNAISTKLTDCFRKLAYRPRDPRERGSVVRLIGDDEQIAASCFDAGYFTFATGQAAAAAMFADARPMKEVRKILTSGVNGHEYKDLTLLNGRCLAVFDPAIGIGPGKASLYNNFFCRTGTDVSAQLSVANGEELAGARHFVREATAQLATGLGPQQMGFLDEKLALIDQLLASVTEELL